jgi:hypothetical protein
LYTGELHRKDRPEYPREEQHTRSDHQAAFITGSLLEVFDRQSFRKFLVVSDPLFRSWRGYLINKQTTLPFSANSHIRAIHA